MYEAGQLARPAQPSECWLGPPGCLTPLPESEATGVQSLFTAAQRELPLSLLVFANVHLVPHSFRPGLIILMTGLPAKLPSCTPTLRLVGRNVGSLPPSGLFLQSLLVQRAALCPP